MEKVSVETTYALVLGDPSKNGVGPGSLNGEELRLGERKVLENLGGLLGVLAEKAGFGLGSSGYNHDVNKNRLVS